MKPKTEYIGFKIRFSALIIDNVFLMLIGFLLFRFLVFTPLTLFKIYLLYFGFFTIGDAFYEIFMTYRYGGTFGKLLMRCKVVSEEGNFSLWKSVLRYFSKIISFLTLCIGFLMIVWDKNKQGLHDKIAKSLVVQDNESRVSEKVKKAMLVISMIILTCYILYMMYTFTVGGYLGMQISSNKLDLKDPVSDIKARCGRNFFFYRDFCLDLYTGAIAQVTMDTESKLGLCNEIWLDSIKYDCVSKIALATKNMNTCSRINSAFYTRLCEKLYDFEVKIEKLFDTGYKIDFDNSLAIKEFKVGIERQDYEVYPASRVFTQGEVLILRFNEVSKFQKNNENLNVYDIDIKVTDNMTNLVYDEENILNTEKKYLENDKLATTAITYKLKDLDPGQYNIEIFLYDVVAKKGNSVNVSIEISESSPYTGLELIGVTFGRETGNDCVEVKDNIFTKTDRLCLKPFVKGFEKDTRDYNWFDIHVETFSSNGSLVSFKNNMYGNDGYVKLHNNSLDDGIYTIYHLDLFQPGTYNYSATVEDKLSGEKIKITKDFKVVNPSFFGTLTVDYVKLGIDDGHDCNWKQPTFSNKLKEALCIEPVNVQGFEKGGDGKIAFDMDLIIIDSEGVVVEHITEAFGEDENIYLPTDYLNDNWVFQNIEGWKPGEYDFELIIYDFISRKQVSSFGKFKIV